MTIIFWIVVLVGIAFGIKDYKGPPEDHRYGYLTGIVILCVVCMIGLRVFPING